MGRLVRIIGVIAFLSSVFAGTVLGENWCSWEGFQHQMSSPVDLDPAPGTVTVKYDLTFDKTWSYWDYYDRNFQAFNLVYYNGYLAFVATTEEGVPTGYDYAHVVVLNAGDGSVATCIDTRHPHSFSPGACEYAWGVPPLGWDPETGILYMCMGGDHPNNNAYLPLTNMGQYDPGTGVAVQAKPAFEDFDEAHPNFRSAHNAVRVEEDASDGEPPMAVDEWNIGTFGPDQHASNRSASFDLQPGSQIITCGKGTGHNKACSTYQTNKFTGRCCREDWDQFAVTETGWPVFKFWHGSIVSGNRVYYFGPYDPSLSPPDNRNAQIGLHLTGIEYEFHDNFDNDGYSGPGYRETAHPKTPFLFDYKVESDTSDGSVSWPGLGGNSQLVWLAEGDGIWVVWGENQTNPYELVHATPSGLDRYFLGTIGAGDYFSGNYNYLAYTDCGAGGEYLVFCNASDMAVFSKDEAQIKWTYDLASAYPSMSNNKMVVAGRHALVAWLDLSGGNAVLNVASFDVTVDAPVSPPAPFQYELTDVPSAAYAASRVRDIIAVNGVLYVLLKVDHDTAAFIDMQRIIAIQPPSRSTIDVQMTVTPQTGPARVVAVCDASGSTSTAAGDLTIEWDFEYDFLSFDADDSGPVVSHIYTYDEVNTEANRHHVAARVTDSTGHKEVRSAMVTVTPDEAAPRSTSFAVVEEAEINTTENEWNETGDYSGGRMRCSGTYGGDFGTGEHSRGYADFETVTLDASYTLVEAKLYFNVARINNTGPSTVHRLGASEGITSASTWADISNMTGVDQDGDDVSPITPLDTRDITSTGRIVFFVTDAVDAWLGRGAYAGSPQPQNGFLLCVDDNAAPGTLETGCFYAGEKDRFQWDWDPGEAYLELVYMDPTASTSEEISGVMPGSTPGEAYPGGTPLDIFWSSSGPVEFVDMEYSTAGAGGPWTVVATGEANDGHFLWAAPVEAAAVWLRVLKPGDASVSAVSANSFEVTASGPDATPPTVAASHVVLSGTVSDSGSGVSEVLVDGVATGVSGGTWTSHDVALGAGVSSISVSASDASGNTTDITVAVGP